MAKRRKITKNLTAREQGNTILLDMDFWRHLQAVEEKRIAYIADLETKVLELEQRVTDLQTELDKANTLIELAIKTSLVLADPEETPVIPRKPKVKRKDRRRLEQEEYNGYKIKN